MGGGKESCAEKSHFEKEDTKEKGHRKSTYVSVCPGLAKDLEILTLHCGRSGRWEKEREECMLVGLKKDLLQNRRANSMRSKNTRYKNTIYNIKANIYKLSSYADKGYSITN
jgi:hypothetical protein